MRDIRSVFKYIFLTTSVLALILGILFEFPSTGHSATVDELKQKIQSREAEIKQLEAEIAEYQKSLENQSKLSSSLTNEIKRLETQIKKLNADIKLTETQITRAELRIGELSGEITTKEATIQDKQKVLGELLKTLDESDDESVIEIMLSYANIADFFSDREASLSVNETIETQLRDLHKEKEELQVEKTNKEKEEEEFVSFKKDLSARKIAQESLTSSKSTLLKQSKNQESQYQKLVKEREEKRAAINKEMQSIEDELRKLIDVNSLPGKRSGVLSWPVANPVLTQGFGLTEFAMTYGSDVYKGNGHNGIDLKASIGTRLLSAADGVVKDLGNADALCPGGSYGKWIVVEHTNGLTTLYAHLSSFAVTKGAQVKRGDLIGYSGDTGFITGPHLHFTVYASNTYKMISSRHCGMLPAGGYVNPLDYL